jgi:hypothetical protein
MEYIERWKPSYLTNQTMLHVVAFVFIALNILMICETARPKVEGQIPRYWWPVVIGAVAAFSTVYWSVFVILQLNLGDSETVGQKIGLQVDVYRDGDAALPEGMRLTTEEANVNDGTRRRVDYKVWNLLASILSYSLWK